MSILIYFSTLELSNLFTLFVEDIAFVEHSHRFRIYKHANLGVAITSYICDVYYLYFDRAIINNESVDLPRDEDKRSGTLFTTNLKAG